MKHVKSVRCKLEPTSVQREALLDTLQVFANACDYALSIAIEHNTANKIRLQKLCYYYIRSEFGLSANLTIQAIRRVAAAYKAARAQNRKPRKFKPTSVNYDQRIFSLKEFQRRTVPEFEASLSTIRERVKGIPLAIGSYQRSLLTGSDPKAATLIYDRKHKRFFLNIVLEWNVAEPRGGGNVIGVDLGLKNLATCSNGLRFPGGQAINVRRRYSRLRQSLATQGTRGAKRTARRLSGKEHRWMKAENHRISRRIVDSLQPGDTIVLEDLTHIRRRTQVRKEQRYLHESWPFRQLQRFIEYKALERGIGVVYVDPHNTSKSCSRCGAIGVRQGLTFSCACGYRNHADYNGSYNIALRWHGREAGHTSWCPEATHDDAKGSCSLEQLRPSAVASP
ncbi:MAG: RNA-guided endonuclease InsQ/TnpB family protein [Candidatus Bipolaricaulia bacterium]